MAVKRDDEDSNQSERNEESASPLGEQPERISNRPGCDSAAQAASPTGRTILSDFLAVVSPVRNPFAVNIDAIPPIL